MKNTIVFTDEAADFVCEALDIKEDPKDIALIQKGKIVKKSDGLIALINALEEEEHEN